MNSPFTLGVLAKSRTNSFWGRDLRDGVEDEARRVGIVVEYRAPSMTSQVKEQGELLEELIQLGCHTIAVAPCDPFSGVQMVKRLNKCGIRPILFDTAIAVNTAIPEGVQQTNALVYSSLMIDDEEGGRSTARYHQNLFPEGREVLILDGYRAGSYSARVKGYIEELGKGLSLLPLRLRDVEEGGRRR
jgi:ABC-type sugar transport system substrate-binding protein